MYGYVSEHRFQNRAGESHRALVWNRPNSFCVYGLVARCRSVCFLLQTVQMNPIATIVADSPAPGHAADSDRATDARFQFQQAVAKQAQLEQLLKQGRAILLDLRSRFDQVCAQRDQVATELDELKNEHQRCASVHQQFQFEQAQLRASLDESHAHALRLKDEQIDAVGSERAALAAERDTLSVQLIERDMQLSERDAHLAERDTRVREYDAAHEQMMEERAQLEERMTAVAADHRQELNAMEQTVKRLEPLAEAGRLAREVGEELRRAAEDIDARAGHLLADLEQLRSDAVRAGSLGRRLVERDQSRVEE
jgi:chromosome segregation ATPase